MKKFDSTAGRQAISLPHQAEWGGLIACPSLLQKALRRVRVCQILVLSLTAQIALPAENFWTAREPAQWTAAEIKKMVTDSPWAKEAIVNATARVSGQAAERPSGAPPGWFGAPDGAETPAIPRILVRWDSAIPVSEACDKGGLEPHLFSCVSKLWSMAGLAGKFAEYQKNFYIVSMSHYPRIRLAASTPEHSAAGKAALEQMGQRLQQSTQIKRSGKAPIRPKQVLVLPAGPTMRVEVFFSREDPIRLEDKEVVFESAGEMLNVTSKFNLKMAVYKGKLEL